MKRIIAFLSLIVVFVIPSQAQENSLLWKVTSPNGKSTSYLFGTYHIVGSDYLNDHKKVQAAYLSANSIVVETEMDSTQMIILAMKGMMIGNSLKGLLDSADYAMVKAEIGPSLGLDLAQLDQFKPVFIAIMYSLALAQEYTPAEMQYGGAPIDQFFAANGRELGKEINILETSMEQADILFDSQTVEEQAADLVELAKDKNKVVKMTKAVIQSYMNEDLKTMYEEAQKVEEASGDLDVLLDDRNEKWIGILNPILTKGKAFIAVGALHLPGEKGLIELLKKEGFTLSPVL